MFYRYLVLYVRDQVGNRWDLRGKMGVVTGCEACTIEGPACSPSTQDWLNFHRATQHNSKIVTPAIHRISRDVNMDIISPFVPYPEEAFDLWLEAYNREVAMNAVRKVL